MNVQDCICVAPRQQVFTDNMMEGGKLSNSTQLYLYSTSYTTQSVLVEWETRQKKKTQQKMKIELSCKNIHAVTSSLYFYVFEGLSTC